MLHEINIEELWLTSCTQGKLYVRGDSKVFRFVSSKSASLFLQRKNPRRIAWTVLYRRMHKKGVTEEGAYLAINAEKV
jgi:ribosomal protein L24E